MYTVETYLVLKELSWRQTLYEVRAQGALQPIKSSCPRLTLINLTRWICNPRGSGGSRHLDQQTCNEL